MEIWVTTLRIRIIATTVPFKPTASSKLVVGLTVLLFASLFLHAPLLFMKRVELINEVGNETYYYQVTQTEFGKSRTSLIIENMISIVRILCASVVLVALNLVAVYMYSSILNRKPKLLDFKREHFFL
jgi:hypothetical protein